MAKANLGCHYKMYEVGESFAVSYAKVSQAVEKLNHRPRKCLDFRTSYEVLFKPKTVALRT